MQLLLPNLDVLNLDVPKSIAHLQSDGILLSLTSQKIHI
jgi:hypothetical protein